MEKRNFMEYQKKSSLFKKSLFRRAFVLISVLLFANGVMAEEDAANSLDKSLKDLKLGILAYIDYSSGKEPAPNGESTVLDEVSITRGYFTLEKKMTPWLGARMTLDVYQDTKTANNGNYEARLKYYYGVIYFPDLGPVLTNIKSEIGMGHMPWLDFEEHVNPYRCQGTMAIERAGIFNSSDLGAGLMGYIGGELKDAGKKTGNHHYNGYLGSWHVGVYNGGGYHATENNENKAIEGRITIRPLPMVDILSGLQFSYMHVYAEGNTVYVDPENGGKLFPEYVVQLGMASYENPYIILTAQYFKTLGNAKGSMIYEDVNDNNETKSLKTRGYSFFARLTIPVLLDNRVSLFGRYDKFDGDMDDKIAEGTAYQMYIGGIAFDLYKGNLLLFSYEKTDYEDDVKKKGDAPSVDEKLGDDNKFQVVLQLKF